MRRMKAVASCAAAFSLVGAFALAACSTAADGGGEEAPPAVQVVTAAEAHDLMTSDRVVVLDVRTQQEYDASHIVNARLLPHDAIDAESAAAAAPVQGAIASIIRVSSASENLLIFWSSLCPFRKADERAHFFVALKRRERR